jgi:hypothetical protein
VSCGDSLWPVQAYDYEGSWIRWERRAYERHVRKRPETADWHEAIGKTVSDPNLAVELDGGGTGYYRRNVLTGGQRNCFLFVVVYWTGALGNIATAFPVQEVEKYVKVLRMNL